MPQVNGSAETGGFVPKTDAKLILLQACRDAVGMVRDQGHIDGTIPAQRLDSGRDSALACLLMINCKIDCECVPPGSNIQLFPRVVEWNRKLVGETRIHPIDPQNPHIRIPGAR